MIGSYITHHTEQGAVSVTAVTSRTRVSHGHISYRICDN